MFAPAETFLLIRPTSEPILPLITAVEKRKCAYSEVAVATPRSNKTIESWVIWNKHAPFLWYSLE
jgi:hypothetical protein